MTYSKEEQLLGIIFDDRLKFQYPIILNNKIGFMKDVADL